MYNPKTKIAVVKVLLKKLNLYYIVPDYPTNMKRVFDCTRIENCELQQVIELLSDKSEL